MDKEKKSNILIASGLYLVACFIHLAEQWKQTS